jgi:hypothetical protein
MRDIISEHFGAGSRIAAGNGPWQSGLVAVALSLPLAFWSAMAADAAGERFRFDQDNVPGWALMTSAERAEHHQKLLGFRRLNDCKAYMEEHGEKMEERAKERNRILRVPPLDVCNQMKARGLLE